MLAKIAKKVFAGRMRRANPSANLVLAFSGSQFIILCEYRNKQQHRINYNCWDNWLALDTAHVRRQQKNYAIVASCEYPNDNKIDTVDIFCAAHKIIV